MKRLLVWMLAVLLLSGVACRQQEQPRETAAQPAETQAEPAKEAEDSQTAEPAAAASQSGREAFHKLAANARLWAPDARPVRLESEPSTDPATREGKASMWRGTFASPSRRGMRPYQWSGEGEGGVMPGPENEFNPQNISTQPFDFQALRTDTPAAFEVAQKRGGEKLLRQNPDLPVFYVLDWDARTSMLNWIVVYGPSQNAAKLRVAVNASNGEFVRILK